MSDSGRFALLRPELHASLARGEEKIMALMRGHGIVAAAGAVLIEAGTEHEFVYRLREGWACRTRVLPDGREQCILIFLPGDLFAVKSMFVTRHPDSVRVLSNAQMERLSHRELHDAYARDADVSNRCTWQVMEEERRLHNWVVGLGRGSAEERLAARYLREGQARIRRTGQQRPGRCRNSLTAARRGRAVRRLQRLSCSRLAIPAMSSRASIGFARCI